MIFGLLLLLSDLRTYFSDEKNVDVVNTSLLCEVMSHNLSLQILPGLLAPGIRPNISVGLAVQVH